MFLLFYSIMLAGGNKNENLLSLPSTKGRE
jgi:hypothetical protein